MSTDRELLELAAKAAAIDGFWSEGYLSFIKRSGGSWDPLTDDGDALRLAVELGMNVYACNPMSMTAEIQPDADGGRVIEKAQINYNDPYAATRRAIVRAAAEIGRNTK